MKYNHSEAFCLMTYECKEGHQEILWNSRDGVTPFIITCRQCGSESSHIYWEKDKCCPDYKPYFGQRIFVDLTKEKHEEYMKKRVDRFWNYSEYPMSKDFKNKEEAVKSLSKNYNEGEPDVIIWKE